MKKSVLFASAMMLLAATACNKEIQGDNPTPEAKPQVELSFNASLTVPTKTEIGVVGDKVDGVAEHQIYWSKGDKIAVYPHDPASNSGVAGVEFTSEDLADAAAAEAEFKGTIDAADTYYAFYPVTAGAKWVGSYADFTVNLPAEQTSNGIASGFAVANVTGSEKVTFEHVCGFVKFTIDETYAGKIKEVRFSGKNSESLAGKLFVYPDDMSRNKINSSQQTVLTLSPSAGETFAAGTYYFTCFPVELTTGLELTFIDSDDKEAVKSSDAAAIIERAGVLNLGTVANLEFESVTPPIADGTYVILAKQSDVYYAMKSTHESNAKRFDEVEFDIKADETHIASAVWNLKNIEGAKYEITNSNKYLTASSDDNNANIGDAKTEMKIVDNGDGTFQIIDVETLRNLSRNNSSLGFAFYATTSQNYNLYLKAVTYVEMPELQAPVISVTGNNADKTVTVTWTDVENATSYEVVCGDQSATVDAGVQTCTFTMTEYGTYEVSVTAKADGYVSATSATVTVTIKDPNDNSIVLKFPDDNKDNNKTNQYTNTWTAKSASYEWSIVNFSNNNWNWTSIKCGRKSDDSRASISTKTVIDNAISKVIVTYGNVSKTDKLNSATLEVSSSADFTNIIETIDIKSAVSKGEQTYTITAPSTGRYYRLTYDMQATGSNGCIEIQGIKYIAD